MKIINFVFVNGMQHVEENALATCLDLSASYPPIRGTEGFMRAPTMEAGMRSGNLMGIEKNQRGVFF